MNLFLLFLLALSSAGIIYTLGELNRSRKALRRYDSLSSQENFIEQLNLDIHNRQRELASLTINFERLLSKYDGLYSQDELKAKLDTAIHSSRITLFQLEQQRNQLETHIYQLRQQVSGLEEESHLQSLGFYEPKYDFISSELYKKQFDAVREQQKKMIKNGSAAICKKTWVVVDDEKKGKKMISDYLKLLRGTFDNTCDAAISNAKSNNIASLEKKIRDIFERLNKWSKTLECEITENYLKLRLRELDLKYEMEIKKEEERDRDRLIREQMAKEKKEREAIEKARQEEEEAAQREISYQQEIKKIRREIEESVGQERKVLERKSQELEKLLDKARSDREDAISRGRKIKSGYIYVISSMGSFEQGIYRIFMTQSDDPDKYIKGMNPVVPFPFDIYFKVYSEDVSATINILHQRFVDRRVNKINPRREFFRVSLDEIEQAINEISRETPNLKSIQRIDAIPLADEYRRSRSADQKDSHSSTNFMHRNDETA
jgi:hypothetical protein